MSFCVDHKFETIKYTTHKFTPIACDTLKCTLICIHYVLNPNSNKLGHLNLQSLEIFLTAQRNEIKTQVLIYDSVIFYEQLFTSLSYFSSYNIQYIFQFILNANLRIQRSVIEVLGY